MIKSAKVAWIVCVLRAYHSLSWNRTYDNRPPYGSRRMPWGGASSVLLMSALDGDGVLKAGLEAAGVRSWVACCPLRQGRASDGPQRGEEAIDWMVS
jgi:hypothetical protein